MSHTENQTAYTSQLRPIDADFSGSNIRLPVLPQDADDSSLEIYTRFMRHLRHVPNSRAAIKILSAVQFTADMIDYSDANVAKVLVDLGLLAPRMAFPAEFLDFADQALMRSDWDVGGPNAALLELKDYWDQTGEDKFIAARRDYTLLDEQAITG